MSQFVYDRFSVYSREEQYERHIRSNNATNIDVAINESIAAYNSRADQSDQILREGIEAQTEQAEALQGTITEGMEGLQDQMADVKSAANTAAIAQIMDARRNAANIVGTIEESSDKIGRALCDNLGMLIDQQRVGNLLSRNIAELLRVPDFQKERLYFMEQGFKHYKNAALDPSMMEDALENLLKAEEREKSDYFTLQRLGMIYLYWPSLVDAAKAEDYFLRAGRYALVESAPEAARLAHVLTGHIDEPLADQIANPVHIKKLASKIYLHAAEACDRQEKFSDAVAHAQKAAELSPGNMLPVFKTAKYLALDNRSDDSVKLLEHAIRQDRDISVLAADDPDLATKPEVTTLLERLRDEAALLLDEQITKLEAMNSPLLEPGEVFFDDFMKLKQRRQDGRYQQLMTGLDAVKKLPAKVREEEAQRRVAKAQQLERERIAKEHRLEQERLEAEAKKREEERKKAEQQRLEEEQKMAELLRLANEKRKTFFTSTPYILATTLSLSGLLIGFMSISSGGQIIGTILLVTGVIVFVSLDGP